jgi:hypothetical protein
VRQSPNASESAVIALMFDGRPWLGVDWSDTIWQRRIIHAL